MGRHTSIFTAIAFLAVSDLLGVRKQLQYQDKVRAQFEALQGQRRQIATALVTLDLRARVLEKKTKNLPDNLDPPQEQPLPEQVEDLTTDLQDLRVYFLRTNLEQKCNLFDTRGGY